MELGARSSSAIVVILSLLIASGVIISMNWKKDKDECTTKGCVNVAADILNALDTTVDPCNDFYQYTCGGWIKNNPIPEDKYSSNQFSKIGEENLQGLKEILSTDHTNDRSAIKKAKIYYKACTNSEAISEACALPTYDLMADFGGFPLFGTGIKEDTFSLEKYLANTKVRIVDKYTKISSPIINMEVAFDDKDAGQHVIVIDQPMLGMPTRDYYLNDDFNSTQEVYRKFLRDFIVPIWRRWDTERNSTTFDEDAIKQAVDEIYEIEKDLAEILEPDEKRVNTVEIYNKMTLGDMSTELSSEFDWETYVHDVMRKGGIKIGKRTEIVVYGTPYLTKMMTVLKKYDSSVIQNYVVMYTLARNVDLLSGSYRNTQAGFRKALTGTEKEGERWKTCINKAKALLPMPVGALFVESMFSEDSKQTAVDMINNILEGFKAGIDDLQWMDESTKQAAKKKVDATVKLIGYPDYILDKNDQALDDELKDIELTEDAYFKGQFDLYRHQLKLNLQKMNKPVDREEWLVGPADVTSYYDVHTNSMSFPAAILQLPFFSPSLPYAMNYARVGDAIAHILSYGFDTVGSTYDEIGNLTNWWTEFSREHFDKAADCIRKQYSGSYFEEAEMYLNGNLTLRANIGDNGGMRYAYQGYQNWRKDNPDKEFILPGLEEYTTDQLFFIGNGQIWCASDRQEAAKRMVLQSTNSPGKFRVEGAVVNFEKFGKAFNCKQGEDKLYPNPEDTCRVW